MKFDTEICYLSSFTTFPASGCKRSSRLQNRESKSERQACNIPSRSNIVGICVKLRTDARIKPEISYVDAPTGRMVLPRRSSDIFELRFWSLQKGLSSLKNDSLPQVGTSICLDVPPIYGAMFSPFVKTLIMKPQDTGCPFRVWECGNVSLVCSLS